jgi:hypothetical protein
MVQEISEISLLHKSLYSKLFEVSYKIIFPYEETIKKFPSLENLQLYILNVS